MLEKLWKPSLIGLGILLFIAIGGVLYYLNYNSTQKEPIKIYGVTEYTKKETRSDNAASPSVKNDTHRDSNNQKGTETADTSVSTPTAPFSDNVDRNTATGEVAQQDFALKTSHQNDKEKDERLTKEEVQARLRRSKTTLRELQNSLEDIKKRDEPRLYRLAEKLNTLSAAEQIAHFEEYRSQHSTAKEFIRTAFLEKARNEAASLGYSEPLEEFFNQIEQTILEKTDGEWVQQHIEELRKYGFKPKFKETAGSTP